MLAVTSFNPEKQPYGLRCLQTLSKYFPGKIVAYTEGDVSVDRVESRDFWSIPGVKDYLERIKRVAGADGYCPEYDYQFDASKFCRKVFAQDAAFDLDTEVFWFDADCVVLKEIPEDFLRGLVSGVPFCYFGRSGKGAYTETGFVGFNAAHEKFKDFRSKYLSCFTTGRIFKEKLGWHDCIAFYIARQGIEGKNLSPAGAGMSHVMLNSALTPFLEHLKGPKRKVLGYSPGHPYNDPSMGK